MTDAGESKRAGQGFTAVGKGDSKSGEAKLVEETPEELSWVIWSALESSITVTGPKARPTIRKVQTTQNSRFAVGDAMSAVDDSVGFECAFRVTLAKAGRVSIGLHHQGASYINRIQGEVSAAERAAEKKRVEDACQSDYLGHPDGIGFNSDGTLSLEGKEKAYGKSFGSGDVVIMRVRFDLGELQFAVNGAWQGVALKGLHHATPAVGLLCEGDAAETLSFRVLRQGYDTKE